MPEPIVLETMTPYFSAYPPLQISSPFPFPKHTLSSTYSPPVDMPYKSRSRHANCTFPIISLRPSSHGNATVPFHLRSNIWNGQIGCSHVNGAIAKQCCFVLRRERNRSVDMFSSCLFRREWNDCVSFHFRIMSLVVPFFGTERFYSKHSRLNATLQRSTIRNNMERLRSRVNGT